MKRHHHAGPLSPITLGPVLGLVALALTSCTGSTAGVDVQSVQTWVVERGDLRITVREKAEIQAEKQVTVKSRLEGRATLIYLAPEGTMVKTGDKLAQLDVSALEEKRSRQAIAVAKAEAALEQAKKSLEIMEEDLAAERNAAEGKRIIAHMELEKFLGRPRGGAGRAAASGASNAGMLAKLAELLDSDPQGREHADLIERVRELLGAEDSLARDMGQLATKILQQIDDIRLARSELELNLDTYNHSVHLASREFITRNELDRDRLNYESQLSKVSLAWNELGMLINYTLRQDQIRLAQDVENAELGLLSVIGNNGSRRVREQVELKSKQAELRLAQESLDNWERQIESGTLLAPQPGLVIYAKRGSRWSPQVVEEGLEVRKGQSLIHLPDLDGMIAILKIQEADIENVSLDQQAYVRADALAEQVIPARVSKIAPLPESGPRFSDTLKVYKATVTLEDIAGIDLRPGMNASVEIIVDILHDVLTVPTAAVHRGGNTHYVWQSGPGGPVATTVRVGRNSLTQVEITDGLHEGDAVLLIEPRGVEAPEFPEESADMAFARALDN